MRTKKIYSLLIMFVIVLSLLGIIFCGNDNDKQQNNTKQENNNNNNSKTNNDIKELTLAIGEWSPYVSENLDEYGFCAEIVTKAFKRAGINIKYEFYPWNRCEELVRRGEILATFPYADTEERRKTFNFSELLVESSFVFFYDKRKVSPPNDYKDLSELKEYKIATFEGYFYEKMFAEAGLTKLDPTPETVYGIKKLLSGRVDLCAEDLFVGWHVIRQNFTDEEIKHIGVIPKPFSINKMSFMASQNYKNSEQILKLFNDSLETIKKDGTYDEIIKEYAPQTETEKDQIYNIGVIDYPPYEFKENGELTGFDIEVTKAILDEMGLKSKWIEKKWPHLMTDLKAGIIHFLPNTGFSEDRKKFMRFTKPYANLKYNVFVHNDNTDIGGKTKDETIKSLYGKKVAIVSGYIIKDVLREHKEIKLLETKTDDEGIEKLVNGEVEAFVTMTPYILYQKKIKNYPIKFVGEALINRPYATTITMKLDESFVEKYNKALEKIQENGVFDKIHKKWASLLGE